jgi:hypothetical protein
MGGRPDGEVRVLNRRIVVFGGRSSQMVSQRPEVASRRPKVFMLGFIPSKEKWMLRGRGRERSSWARRASLGKCRVDWMLICDHKYGEARQMARHRPQTRLMFQGL